ncbi:MAG: hypothetical protein DMF24_10660 [Verrucomicrobia bacterium]|nr:MAG: hypothetical protein DMF24_10660 [Verrucomicrobiota bacterium]
MYGFKCNVRVLFGFTIFVCATALSRAETSVEIDLQRQMAYLIDNGRPVLASPISSGRYGHLTRTGSFKVLEKERSHYSSMYGKIVDAYGNTIVADADADMHVARCVPWLCSHATTAGNCLLQFRQCRYSGDRVWQNTR